MRASSVALLAAVIALAGCSSVPFVGGGGDEAPAATPIPRDQLTDPEPPGVSSGQVLSPTTLGRAHARAIENESYVLSAERTVRHADGTLRSRLAMELALDADRTYLVNVSTAGPEAPVFLGRPPAAATYWSDGTTYLRRLTRDGRTTHNSFGPPPTWVGTWSYWANSVPFGARGNHPRTYYASLFDSVPAEVTGPTTFDGARVVRVELQGGDPFSDDAFPDELEEVRDVSLVALIDDDGLVRSLDLQYVATVDGEPVTVHRTVRYLSVGSTSVGRPSWYGRAMEGPAEEGEADRNDTSENASARDAPYRPERSSIGRGQGVGLRRFLAAEDGLERLE